MAATVDHAMDCPDCAGSGFAMDGSECPKCAGFGIVPNKALETIDRAREHAAKHLKPKGAAELMGDVRKFLGGRHA